MYIALAVFLAALMLLATGCHFDGNKKKKTKKWD